MDSLSPTESWESLTVELRKQAEAIFHSLGEVVLVETSENSKREIALISKTKRLKLTFVPERSAVKWETPTEYGFEKLQDLAAALAMLLMRKVRPR